MCEGHARTRHEPLLFALLPQIFDFPALPAIFYIFAVWFTIRLVRSIRRL